MSDSSQTLIIGVDGGGTGCRAAIGTVADGLLARAEGGRSNPGSDFDQAIQNILSTVKMAADKANVSDLHLANATTHLGLAGVMTPQDSDRIAAALPYKKSVVTDDRTTTLIGALGGKDGFLLSVGTGTIAAASKAGNVRYVGGWGFNVSDQASGAWLGRAALERVLLCYDGLGQHSDVTRAVFAKFDNNPNAISTFGMSAKPGDFGRFAPDIVDAARSGDPWAQSILQKGVGHLTDCLAVLGFETGDLLCLAGGLGPHYAPLLPSTFLAGHKQAQGSALEGAFQLAKTHAIRLSGENP